MPPLLKGITWALGILLGIVVVGAVLLWALFDPNDYRDEIEQAVQRQTGRAFSLGRLSLSLAPPGVTAGPSTLANAKGFGSEPMGRFESATLQARLLPLLVGHLEIKGVKVDGLQLRLERNRAGTTNWSDLQSALQKPSQGEGSGQGGAGSLPARMEIGDATLVWSDARVGRQWEFTGLDFKGSGLGAGYAPVSLSFRFKGDKPSLQGSASVEGQLLLDLSRKLVQAEQLGFSSDLQGPAIPQGKARMEGRVTGTADLQRDIAEISRLEIAAYGAEALLSGTIGKLSSGGEGSGKLTLTLPRPEELPLPDTIDRKAFHDARLDSSLDFSLITGGAHTQGLTFRAAGFTGGGEVEVTGLTGQPLVSGTFRTSLAQPETLLQALHQAERPPLPAESLKGSTLGGRVRLTGNHLTLSNLAFQGVGANLTGSVEGELTAKSRWSGRLSAVVAQADPLASALGLERSGIRPGALNGTKAESSFRYDGGTGRLRVAPLQVEAQGVRLRSTGEMRFGETRGFTGEVATAPFDPRAAAMRFGYPLPPTRDPKALQRAALSSSVEIAKGSYLFRRLDITLDQTRMNGEASLQGQKLRYNLTADTLDLDRYLAPPAAKAAAKPEEAKPSGNTFAKKLDVEGTLKIGAFKAFGARMSNVSASAAGRAGSFTLRPVSAQLYQGSYGGNWVIDLSGNRPAINAGNRFTGVQLGPFSRDLFGKEYVTGIGDLTVQASILGLSADEWRSSLSGQGAFQMRDGTVRGLNLGGLLRAAYARYKGEPLAATGPSTTDYTSLSGSVTARNGVVENHDLNAQSPALRVGGEGRVNLVTNQVDYRLTVNVVPSPTGQGGPTLAELGGVAVPVQVTGPLGKPSYQITATAALEERARSTVTQEQQRFEEEQRAQAQRRLESERKSLEEQLRRQLSY